MNKRLILGLDMGLIVPAIVLVVISLSTLFSINPTLFKNQLGFFIISILAFIFFSQTNYRIIGKNSLSIYIISIIALILVLIVGAESRGSVRWFEVLGFRVQFSEILKPFLAISFAGFLSNRKDYSYRTFFLTILLLSPIGFLIIIQPDLGNSLIYILSVLLALFIYGFPLRLFFAIFIMTSVLIPFVWRFLHEYQRQRIITFFNPTDPLGFSYNAIQSIIAIGSGMIIGKGLGQGTQSGLKFLPERHTDFIFATVSEGLGFVGAIVVLTCFTFLLYRIIGIFSNAEEPFSKLFAITAFSFILLQSFVNIGMNIGILPVVGITLPFVSYGGSSLLSSFIMIGIVSSISKNAIRQEPISIG